MVNDVKAHPERPLVLTMGIEKYRDRGELLVWHVHPVRVMEAAATPLTAVARVRGRGPWDSALSMCW